MSDVSVVALRAVDAQIGNKRWALDEGEETRLPADVARVLVESEGVLVKEKSKKAAEPTTSSEPTT